MHLKRMELFGFKSFAEKSELELDSGIAAIIGPNGCGKSNIVDAVRWALGEQSVKSLRGTRMEEVIFSGSENRKALNFAEVSLTFDGAGSFLNLDYDEITITRRLFRSGDSEYYINKSPCRLKDITELLLDTGLGKNVYSVIGQGRVDEIINSRPEERREIFEEAAGILKYKLRKREAGRRLEETRENLVRVQDLIYELETQVEPLQEQAAVTRQYRNLRDRIGEEEKKLMSFTLTQSREDLQKTEVRLQAISDGLLAEAARQALEEKERQDLKGRLQEEASRKREEEQELNRLSINLEQQENELKLLKEREERYREHLADNRQRVNHLKQRSEELSRRRNEAGKEYELKKQALSELDSELQVLYAELAGHEESPQAGAVEKQQEKIYRAGARRQAATSALNEVSKRLERLQTAQAALGEEEKELLQKQEALDKEIARARQGLEDLLGTESRLDSELETAGLEESGLRKELEQLGREEQKIKETLQGIRSRLNLLREQDSAMSGYYRGVKEVIRAGSRLPGIVGPVADLISLEEEHIQAVESSVGGSLQYLVSRTEKDALDAVRYLKENNRGYATFLPLDILHRAADPLERYSGWRDLPGVIGRVSELVKVDREYRAAVDYLMASIVVCQTLQDASRLARFTRHSCRVVTLDGEMINPGGVIRGGSMPRRSAGLPLGRRNEIKALQAEETRIADELQKAGTGTRAAAGRLAEAVNRMQALNERKRAGAAELTEAQKGLDHLLREQSILEDRLLASRQKARELGGEKLEAEQRLGALEEEIEVATGEIETMEEELSGARENYRQFLEQKKALEEKITATLVGISSGREQLEALTARIAEVEENLLGPAKEIQEIEESETRYNENLEEISRQREKVTGLVGALNTRKASLMESLEQKTSALGGLEARLIETEEESRRRQARVARQEKKENQLSVEQTRLKTEISYQEMRFRELFGSLETLTLPAEYEPEESRFLVENLKEDLEALGEVNLGAIEELARLEDRINFLREQRDDLQKGEAALGKVLSEIDQRMEFYFSSAFQTINDNFRQTFLELFQGGQAVLKLTDPANILEAGIDIIAQPPGKKLQNITLLSAGEKVLTAIALVFAILRFKPAPFYLLDEVESTLDDANLARFTEFLKQTARQAQFIMITHRRRTMQEAGILYGVTMPEPGVSRLMSLKLEENQMITEK